MMDVPLTIGAIMRHGTTVHRDAEVVTWTGGEPRRATFGEVGRRAAQLAGALRELGVTSDQRVATFQWNNQEHLEAYLAVPSMGAVLHTLNIRLGPDQVAWIANHAEDHVVIVDGSLVPLLAKALPECKTVRHVVVTGEADTSPLAEAGAEVHSYDGLLAGKPEQFDWPDDIDERSAAAMCYTSGTTGNPKGVTYSHRSAYLHSMALLAGEAAGLTSADRCLPVVPMFHANAWGIPYGAVMAGSSLVMPDRFLQAQPLVEMVERERPTMSGAVPSIWNDVMRHLREHGGDFSSMRVVLCGGSAVPRALMQAFDEEVGVTILQAWGMTETSPLASIAAPPVGVEGEQAWRYRTTAGRMIIGVQGRVAGDDDSVLPSDGESVGEIEVRGPWVTGRYNSDADPDRFHDGWLRTGDVGTIDELGYITISDRSKDVIKSGGEWISSVELENALMGHPAVLEAAVIGVPDTRWEERPLAAVVVAEGESVTPDQLREFLGDSVPKWQVPDRWSFIPEVPKTSVGKFDKKVIRQRYADGDLEVHEQT
jgi:fatty-acyl-CoA synthase